MQALESAIYSAIERPGNNGTHQRRPCSRHAMLRAWSASTVTRGGLSPPIWGHEKSGGIDTPSADDAAIVGPDGLVLGKH